MPTRTETETGSLTWYGRLAVWFGAVMLLVQSVTGRGVGIATVVAVAALTVGFVAFLGGLALGGYRARQRDAVTSLPVQEVKPQDRTAIEPSSVPTLDAMAAENPTRAEHANGAVPRIGERKVRALQVRAGMPQAGQLCPRCKRMVEIGQMAATCFVCSGVHHAGCWVENDFSCATPSCPGRGDLEAPRRATAPGELEV